MIMMSVCVQCLFLCVENLRPVAKVYLNFKEALKFWTVVSISLMLAFSMPKQSICMYIKFIKKSYPLST